MNFKIIEGHYDDDFSDIYTDFEKEYLNTKITNPELRSKYGLSRASFSKLVRKIKKNNDIDHRPRHGKYYFIRNNQWVIHRRQNGVLNYFGCVHVKRGEETLKKALQICDDLNWEVESCREEIKKL